MVGLAGTNGTSRRRESSSGRIAVTNSIAAGGLSLVAVMLAALL
jgi:hypothetical protein